MSLKNVLVHVGTDAACGRPGSPPGACART